MRWENQLYVIILFCSRIKDTYSNGLGRTRSKSLPKTSTVFTFTIYHLEKSACCFYIPLYDFREKLYMLLYISFLTVNCCINTWHKEKHGHFIKLEWF